MKQIRCTPELAQRMKSALMARPHSMADLRAITGLSEFAVRRWLKTMRAVDVVHVCRWGEDERGRAVTPIYTWGAGPDAVRRQPATAAERMAATRARRKGMKS